MSTIDLDGGWVFRDTHLDDISVTLKIKLTMAPTLPQPFTSRSFIPEGVEAEMKINDDGEWFAASMRFFGYAVKANGDRGKNFVNDARWAYFNGRYGFHDMPAPEYVLAVAGHCVERVHQVLL